MLKKKVCMVGQFGVGKSSLVRRFVHRIFSERYLSTVGVNIDSKEVMVGNSLVTLVLWDLAGEDDLAQLNVGHIRGASGYIVVADGCRAATLDKAIDLHRRIVEIRGPLPFALVLNKTDLRDQWEISENARQSGWPAFETSAKTGSGVEEMFHWLAEQLLLEDAGAGDPHR